MEKFAKKNKLKILSFLGFTGGYIKKKSNISIHFPINNYGISEDCNHIVMHSILQFLKQKQISSKKNYQKYFLMNFKLIKTLFFPLLKLELFEKILFFLILLLTCFLIIFDILTISLISIIFFDKSLSSNNLILENFINFFTNLFDQNNKIYLLVSSLVLRNFIFFIQEFILNILFIINIQNMRLYCWASILIQI